MVVTHGSVAGRVGRRIEAPQARLLAVADGMGGYEGGEVASTVAIESLAAFVLEIVPWFVASSAALRGHLEHTLEVGVRGSDEAVFRTAIELDLDERMGTTLTAAYITWPDVYIVHVGDSRAYLLRDRQLLRLTRDHTVAEELLAAHALDAEQAARSQLRHVLVNTVGGQRDKEMTVDVAVVELREGDTLVLCTDGVVAHVREEELPDLVVDAHSAEAAARNVLDIVEARGAIDNVTVVVARF
ncbi:MAG: serine/threonine-protein phosphatase [Polyangiaceae bacterium]|nr:serine/threonine-protein phosphatase [Polyangiaceae bacterium]